MAETRMLQMSQRYLYPSSLERPLSATVDHVSQESSTREFSLSNSGVVWMQADFNNANSSEQTNLYAAQARLLRSPIRRDGDDREYSLSVEVILQLAENIHAVLTGKPYIPTVYDKNDYLSGSDEFRINSVRAQKILTRCLDVVNFLLVSQEINLDAACTKFKGKPVSLQEIFFKIQYRNLCTERHNRNLIKDLNERDMETVDLKESVASLELDVRDRETEVADLEEENEAMQNICTELETKIERLQQEIEKRNIMCTKLSEDTKAQQTKFYRSQKEVEHWKKCVLYFENELRQCEKQMTSHRGSSLSKAKDLKKKHSASMSQDRMLGRKEVNELDKERRDLANKLKLANDQNQKLKEEESRLLNRYDSLQTEKSQFEQQLLDNKTTINELERRNRQLQRREKDLEESKKDALDKLKYNNEQTLQKSGLDKRVFELEEWKKSASYQLQQSKDLNVTLTQEKSVLEKRYDSLQTEKSQLEQQLLDNKTVINELERKNLQLQRREKDLEESKKNALDQLKYSNEQSVQKSGLDKRVFELEEWKKSSSYQLQQSEDLIDKLLQEKSVLEKRYDSLQTERSELEQQLLDNKTKIIELERKNRQLQRREKDLEESEKNALDKIKYSNQQNLHKSGLNKRVFELEEWKNSASYQLQQSNDLNDTLKQEKSELEKRVFELEEWKKSSSDQLQQSKDLIEKLLQDKSVLEKRYDSLQTERSQLEQQLLDNKTKINELERKNRQLQRREKDLEESVKNALDKIEYSNQQNLHKSGLDKRVFELEEWKKSASYQLQQSKDLNDTIKQEKSVLEKRINELLKEIAVKEDTLKLHDNVNQELKQLENELNARYESLQTEKSQLEQQLLDNHTTVNELERNNRQLQIRVKELEESRKYVLDKLKDSDEQNNQFKQERKGLEKRINVLLKENAKQDDMLKMYADEEQKLKQVESKLNVRIHELQKECTSLEDKLNDCDEEKKKFEKRKSEFQNRLNELQIQNSRLENSLKDFRTRTRKLEEDKDDLLTRLSQYTSAQLVKDNPDVADLSDMNRPTKLAEKFSELYDNEWTDAFEVLTNNYKCSEEESIKHLLKIILAAYEFCFDLAKQQFNTMKNALAAPAKDSSEATVNLDLDSVQLRAVQDLRKETSHHSVKTVTQSFHSHLKSTQLKTPDTVAISRYVTKCAELCWYMVLLSPPLFVAPPDDSGGVFDKNKYRFYQTSGRQYKHIVWPALYMYREGSMLAKGIAEAF